MKAKSNMYRFFCILVLMFVLIISLLVFFGVTASKEKVTTEDQDKVIINIIKADDNATTESQKEVADYKEKRVGEKNSIIKSPGLSSGVGGLENAARAKKKFRPEMGVALSNASDRNGELWNETFVGVKYTSELGPVIARAYHANRFGEEAYLYEVEAYPRFDKTYFHLGYMYSTNSIFQRNFYLAELYAILPENYEVSCGGRWYDSGDVKIALYTATFARYIGDYWLSVRPYVHFKDGGAVTSVYFKCRRYFDDDDHYVDFTVGGGKAPDNLDIRDGVLDVINTYGFWVSFRTPFCIKGTDFRGSVGIQRDKLTPFVTRRLFSVGIALEF